MNAVSYSRLFLAVKNREGFLARNDFFAFIPVGCGLFIKLASAANVIEVHIQCKIPVVIISVH